MGGASASRGGEWVGLQRRSRPLPRPVRSPAPAPPSGLCGWSGGGAGAGTSGDAGRGAAPRAGPGGRALAAGVARRAPPVAAVRALPPILLQRRECDGRAPRVRWICQCAQIWVRVRAAVCLSERLWVRAWMLFKSCSCLCPREACPCP